LYKPAGEACELMFVATEMCQYFVLSYDAQTNSIVTKAKGEIQSQINIKNENGHIGRIDPDCRVIGLNLFQGQFDVIPIDSKGQLKESFNIRLEEINVVDIQFLYGEKSPTICVLYEDNRNNRSSRHIKTYKIAVKEAEFTEGPWHQPNVELETNMIIPVPEPIGGVLIVGLETIAYRNGRGNGRPGQTGSMVSISVRCGLIKAFAPIDSEGVRWLLTDEWGGLHVLALRTEHFPMTSSTSSSTSSRAKLNVVDLSMEFLGETSIASSLSYLDNGYVFIGSCFGDSQLIRLSEEKSLASNSYVDVVQTCTNIGPILDFCVVDLDRQGQGQVITCSGGFKDGSLRVVRNGIGIDEQAVVDLPGIRMMWSLRDSFESKWEKYLVQSFTGETRFLCMEDEELSETEITGFVSDIPTLFCCNMIGDLYLQATSRQLRLVNNGLCFEWSPQEGRSITVASANATQVLLALDGGELCLFLLEGQELKLVKSLTLDNEIACININPFDNMEETEPHEPTSTNVAAIGMWTDVSIRILLLPTLDEIHREKLTGETIPRSLFCATLKGLDRLFVGLGDGNLFSFDFIRGSQIGQVLVNKKKIALGSRPISLSKFRSRDSTHIFVGSDRPTVIYSTGTKILYSNVNQREVTSMVSFSSEDFPDCLALASEENLTVGNLNEIQKLDVKSFPLGEQPRRICHQMSSRTISICTIKTGTGMIKENLATRPNEIMDEAPVEMPETSYVKLVDDQRFDVLDAFQLDEFETGCAIISCKFKPEHDPSAPTTRSKEDTEYIVVGTAYLIEGEQEPSKGRILVFQVADKDAATGADSKRRLLLVAEKQTRGAVYCLNSFNGKLLAGINSRVKLFAFIDRGPDQSELQSKCGYNDHIIVLYLESHGDFIVVGDLMKSVSLLVYRAVDDTIEEIARDYNANWMTSVGICNDSTFIGAETHMNLFTIQKNSEATSEEARHMLKVSGEFHLGEFVNRFRNGSLVMQQNAPLQTQTSAMELLDQASSSIGGTDIPDTVLTILHSTATPKMLFGSVNGVLGVIAEITAGQYKLLKRVERALSEIIQGVGGLSHAAWRSFSNDRKTSPSKGFIDGDLIEEFLDLDLEDMTKAVDLVNGKVPFKDGNDTSGFDMTGTDSLALNLTVVEVTRLVEDLSRMH